MWPWLHDAPCGDPCHQPGTLWWGWAEFLDSGCQVHEPPGALGSSGGSRAQLGSFLVAAPRSRIGFLSYKGGLASGAL